MGYAIDEGKITLLVPPGWAAESVGRVSIDPVAAILAHEMNHALLHAMMPSQFSVLPRWYIEGLASYYEMHYYEKTHETPVQDSPQDYYLVEALKGGKFTGLGDFSGWAYTEESVGPAYIAGESVFDYVEAEQGWDAIFRFIEDFKGWNTGLTSDTNLNNIFQVSFNQTRISFENGWMDWLRNSTVQAPEPGILPTGAEQLTNTTMTTVPTSWGQAGILYLDGSNGSLDIYLLNVTTRATKALTSGNGTDTDARFSPDGSKIAFSSMRDGTFDLYLMGIDGSSVERLTDDTCVNVAPSWSPDGERLAFVSDRNGSYDILELSLADLSITELVASGYNEGAPTYSPDGTKLAYCSDVGDDMGIQIMDLITGNITQPTEAMQSGIFPSWSPDGSKIAFIKENRDIAVYDINDNKMAVIVENGYEHGVIRVRPVWSPDGGELCGAIYNMRAFTVWDVNIYTFDMSEKPGENITPYILVVVLTVVAVACLAVVVKMRKRASV